MDEPDALPEDLNNLEHRLTAWQPSSEETLAEADRMLFAAGRASACRMRLLWPATAACLALLAAGLGVWVASEREQRLILTQQLEEREARPRTLVLQVKPAPSEPLPADSYLVLRRSLENDPDGSPPPVDPSPAPGLLPEGPPILQVGQRDRWPDL
jgi:hypothetical protein